jgi:serine/threonine-protein kinase SRPK3
LENKSLFEAVDPLKNEYDDRSHLAHITALLGPPPKELLMRGRRTPMLNNSEGKWALRACLIKIVADCSSREA